MVLISIFFFDGACRQKPESSDTIVSKNNCSFINTEQMWLKYLWGSYKQGGVCPSCLPPQQSGARYEASPPQVHTTLSADTWCGSSFLRRTDRTPASVGNHHIGPEMSIHKQVLVYLLILHWRNSPSYNCTETSYYKLSTKTKEICQTALCPPTHSQSPVS